MLDCKSLMTKQELITSQDAAERLNITHNNLLQILSRYPHLKPDTKVNQDYVWSEADLEAVAAHRARSRPGPKPKGK